MPQPIATQLGTFTAAGGGTPRAGQVGDHTFTASLLGSGAVSATVLIEVSNDLAGGWSTLATLTLSGTNSAAAQAAATASHAFWRATVSAMTGASLTVTAATEQVTDASALTSSQKSRLLAVLPATESLVSGAGNGLSLVRSTGYHFHGWAPNQQKDRKWWDYSGSLNDGAFETHLTAAVAYANAGMISQVNPTVASELSLIAIPALSWNWAAGDSLFVFWRGMATPEGGDTPIMGDTSGTAANGVRVVVSSAGKLKVNAYQASGTLSRFGGTSTATVFEAAVEHSFAFCLSGAGTLCYWSDGVRDTAYASGFLALSGGGAIDTSNSATFKLGGDGGTSASIQGGVACQHRALVILKGRASSGAPAVADLDTLVAALHRNPQALVSAAAW